MEVEGRRKQRKSERGLNRLAFSVRGGDGAENEGGKWRITRGKSAERLKQWEGDWENKGTFKSSDFMVPRIWRRGMSKGEKNVWKYSHDAQLGALRI